jgi:putative acyl-CoA dehydrogenase
MSTALQAERDVLNQPPPFADVDLFALDKPLQEAVAANGAGAASAELSAFGRAWGTAELKALGAIANKNAPVLELYDAQGFRRDIVTFHPAYHTFMARSIEAGLHNATWSPEGNAAPPPAEVLRAAKFYMAAQVESGHLCPITMTRASVGALATEPKLLALVMPKIASLSYDPSFAPWSTKQGVTLGMGMTEKQGGTDVRANSSRATRDGDAYRIDGHKWFMSAPMCDAFLVLAQAEDGLTCFFMPRFRPDGSINGLEFLRLKDKLGNRSNASSEVEFRDAFAVRVGDEGQGVRTIIQMVQLTRLDCAISSAGLMRSGLAHAVHHTRYRSVFQKHLIDQPLMRSVLADMALQIEAATSAVMRLCRSFDLTPHDPDEAARMRLLTPVIKYWVCKTAPGFLYEALECLGGNGYVEDGILARHYREAPVNAVWEGSGNVMCLDVLRAFSRDPDAAAALLSALAVQTQGLSGTSEALGAVATALRTPDVEGHARLIVELFAKVAAVAALNETSAEAAECYAATGLDRSRAGMYGAIKLDAATAQKVIERALPE